MPTAEELLKAESIPLEELRALALKEAEEAIAPTAEGPQTQVRDEKGRFTANTEVLDNSGDEQDPNGVGETVEELEAEIFVKEITNDDGSVDRYEADSLEELVDKIAEGKRQAVKQLKTIIAEKRTLEAKTVQTTQDEEYLIQQKLQQNPKSTIKQIVAETIQERLDAAARDKAAQERFVVTHPDFIANPDNGERMHAEYIRIFPNASEFTPEGLDKAYQSLKKSGLLNLKTEEAGVTTGANAQATERTVQTPVSAPQQRSSKRSSTIPTNTRTTSVNVNAQPTLDELYDTKKYPLEKVRELAEAQLAAARNSQ
jgi:hypothetical protein